MLKATPEQNPPCNTATVYDNNYENINRKMRIPNYEMLILPEHFLKTWKSQAPLHQKTPSPLLRKRPS